MTAPGRVLGLVWRWAADGQQRDAAGGFLTGDFDSSQRVPGTDRSTAAAARGFGVTLPPDP